MVPRGFYGSKLDTYKKGVDVILIIVVAPSKFTMYTRMYLSAMIKCALDKFYSLILRAFILYSIPYAL